MQNGAKKSLYVFLTCIMGVLLFLILHRIAIFGWLILQIASYNYFGTEMPYVQVLAIEYITLVILLFFGAWYGIWVGEFWYEKVYMEKSQMGFFGYVASKYFTRRHSMHSLAEKIAVLSKKMENEAQELSGAIESLPVLKVIKKVARKKPSVIKKRSE